MLSSNKNIFLNLKKLFKKSTSLNNLSHCPPSSQSCSSLVATATTINTYIHTHKHTPIGVPRDDVSVEARRDEEPSVGVVFDILHPAGVAVKRANLRAELPQVPQCDGGVIGAGGKQTIVQKPAANQHGGNVYIRHSLKTLT